MLKCSKSAQIRHAFGPYNSKTYGEKMGSIGPTVHELSTQPWGLAWYSSKLKNEVGVLEDLMQQCEGP